MDKDNLFYEITIEEDETTNKPKKELITFDYFISLRSIVQNYSYDHKYIGIIFKTQAKYLSKLEDYYDEAVPFSAYYPNFSQMNLHQVKTYLTWKTKVKKGIYELTSISYVFVYIYELINLVEVTVNEAIKKLIELMKNYGKLDLRINLYIIKWLKDIYIYYDCYPSFSDFTAQNGLTIYYQDELVSKIDATYFDSYVQISSYKILKSPFFETNSTLIKNCFNFVAERIDTLFKAKKKSLKEFVYKKRIKSYIPFSNAIFHREEPYEERCAKINDDIEYIYKDGRWNIKETEVSKEGSIFISYFYKKVEAVLRKIEKHPYPLKPYIFLKPDKFKIFDRIGLDLENGIDELVYSYYKHKKFVSVDLNQDELDKIRDEAQFIQSQLIVEEEIDINQTEVIKTSVLTEVKTETNDWAKAFIDSLSEVEINFIKLLNEEQADLIKFSLENKVMLDNLIDEINNKAIDVINDLVIDSDIKKLYADYKDKIMEMI